MQIGPVIDEIYKIDKRIENVEVLDKFKNTTTLKIKYQDPAKNLVAEEIQNIRKQVLQRLDEKFGIKLKEKAK